MMILSTESENTAMNRYSISFADHRNTTPDGRPTVVDCGTHEGRTARAVLDAFVAERGLADDYTHGSRNSLWGMGCPTLTARKVSA